MNQQLWTDVLKEWGRALLNTPQLLHRIAFRARTIDGEAVRQHRRQRPAPAPVCAVASWCNRTLLRLYAEGHNCARWRTCCHADELTEATLKGSLRRALDGIDLLALVRCARAARSSLALRAWATNGISTSGQQPDCAAALPAAAGAGHGHRQWGVCAHRPSGSNDRVRRAGRPWRLSPHAACASPLPAAGSVLAGNGAGCCLAGVCCAPNSCA